MCVDVDSAFVIKVESFHQNYNYSRKPAECAVLSFFAGVYFTSSFLHKLVAQVNVNKKYCCKASANMVFNSVTGSLLA